MRCGACLGTFGGQPVNLLQLFLRLSRFVGLRVGHNKLVENLTGFLRVFEIREIDLADNE
jgi:hypothetical protein